MGELGLADFLTALRGELAEAHRRAEGDSLRLGVGQMELTLEVAYTLERSGGADAKVKAKFWVLEFGEAGLSGSIRSEHVRTQHLKLLLTPRLEGTVVDAEGVATTKIRVLDVHGQVDQQEEQPELPEPPRTER
ncbi:trypco2 family protein [Kribbella sp. NBC_00359]|uniref:trypco2 family protein n=1 Tax=Kribbella sp. NBC_00359 TaxID=2975966 RepID=UPI002E1F3A2C